MDDGTCSRRTIDPLTLATPPANEFVAPLHDRIPPLLLREALQLWLFAESEVAAKLIASAPGTVLAAHRVSERVNKLCGNVARLRGGLHALTGCR